MLDISLLMIYSIIKRRDIMSKTSPKEFVENVLRDKGYYVRRVEDVCIVPKGGLAIVTGKQIGRASCRERVSSPV